MIAADRLSILQAEIRAEHVAVLAAAQTALDRTFFWISQYVEGQPPVTLKNAGSYAQAKTEKKKKKKEAADDLGPPP